MSLNWNLAGTLFVTWSKEKREKNWWLAESLIWLTLGLDFDMGRGDGDIDEFLWRARCYELVHGAWLSKRCRHRSVDTCQGHKDPTTGVAANGKLNIPVPLTRELITPLAGLSTNVIRLSRSRWMTKVKRQVIEKTTNSINSEGK